MFLGDLLMNFLFFLKIHTQNDNSTPENAKYAFNAFLAFYAFYLYPIEKGEGIWNVLASKISTSYRKITNWR